MSKLDALRDAQLWLLRNPSIVIEAESDRGAVREKQKLTEIESTSGRTSPYFWAPFVLSGDWR